MSGPLVYGHRGALKRAVENTIESFDAAEALGVDGIEMDVRVTACGELVLHYAPDFHVEGRQHMISTLTLRELERLVPDRGGVPYRIPTLREIFERYGHGLGYFVELKPCNVPSEGIYEEAVVRLVRHYGLVDHVHVVSFTADLVRRVVALDPGIRTSLVFEHPAAIAALGEESFPRVSALHPKWSIVDDELVARTRAAGLPLHVWFVNDPEELERARDLGIASVTTDAPAALLAALGRPPALPPAPRAFTPGLRRI